MLTLNLNQQNLIYITVIIIAMTFASCQKKTLNPLTYEKGMISLGNGGGFTGVVTTYHILDDGTVFRSGASDTSFIKVGKLDKKIIDQQFSNYNAIGIESMKLNEPGNKYFFISKKDEKGVDRKIQWGKNELSDQRIQIYHRNFMHLIKTLDLENGPKQ